MRMYILTTEYRLQFYSITQRILVGPYSPTGYRDNGLELFSDFVLFKSCAVYHRGYTPGRVAVV